MTVGELIDFLGNYDEDTPIYLSFDNGYTYGGITESHFEEDCEGDEENALLVPCSPQALSRINLLSPVLTAKFSPSGVDMRVQWSRELEQAAARHCSRSRPTRHCSHSAQANRH